jgi:uncharacterized membrane protein
MGEKIARKLTGAMATWSFSGVFLLLCALEMWFNHSGLVPSNFKFDPQTIILNLFLSLVAAIQGSIIMIAQKQADKDRDAIIDQILQLEQKLINLEESQMSTEESILQSLEDIRIILKK